MMYEQQIAAGMRLLDEKMPGWMERVDLHRLDLFHCTHCVLGQLTGDYNSLAANRLIPWTEVRGRAARGFTILRGRPTDFAHLTTEWREAIRARRGDTA